MKVTFDENTGVLSSEHITSIQYINFIQNQLTRPLAKYAGDNNYFTILSEDSKKEFETLFEFGQLVLLTQEGKSKNLNIDLGTSLFAGFLLDHYHRVINTINDFNSGYSVLLNGTDELERFKDAKIRLSFTFEKDGFVKEKLEEIISKQSEGAVTVSESEEVISQTENGK